MTAFVTTVVATAAIALITFTLVVSYVVRCVRRRPSVWNVVAGIVAVVGLGAAILAVALVFVRIAVHL